MTWRYPGGKRYEAGYNMKKVSIKDIAREAGVSNATVSLVLNGKEKEGRVGQEVSGRVKRIPVFSDSFQNRFYQSGERSFIVGIHIFGNASCYDTANGHSTMSHQGCQAGQ